MRRAFLLLLLTVVGCSSREEREAVSTTTITSASMQPIALIGETKSGLRVNLEQSGNLDDAHVALAQPAKLTLRRGDRAVAFRVDGEPSARLRGAFEFAPGIVVVTKDAVEEGYEGDPSTFVEKLGQIAYGDPEKIAPPSLSPSWNALVVVTEQGNTTVESIALRKVRR